MIGKRNSTRLQVSRLQHQNEELAKLVRSEKTAADAMRNEVMQHVSKILQKYGEARDSTLRETTTKLSGNLTDGQKELEKLRLNHGNGINNILSGHKDLLGRTDAKANNGRRAGEDASRALETLGANVSNTIKQLDEHTTAAALDHLSVLERDTEALDAAASGAFERLDKGRQLRVNELTAIKTDASQSRQATQAHMSSMTSSLNATMNDVIVTVSFKFAIY